MANRTVSVSLKAEIADFMGKMGTAARGAKQLGDELSGMGKKNPQQLNDVAMAAGGLGVALLGVAGYAVKAAMAFDKQMSAVGAATGANVVQMNALREAALQAGKETIFSAKGAAEAQTELAKAGVDTADILGGGLTGALSLAAAGQMEVGEAAEIAATAMNQFGLTGAQIPHVADLLAAAAGNAQGSVKDIGMALKQSGLVANQFGVSIEETTGTLASFASAGLIGSDAGTSFKQMLLMLANPSKAAAKTMDELGIAAYDANGQFVGISNLAGQLKDKMGDLSMEQRNQAMATIFGADAIRAANVLYKEGAGGIDAWRKKVNDAGYASRQAAALTNNLAGDLERLKGSFETLAIEAGSGANSGLRLLVKGADEVVGAFSSMPGPLQAAITMTAGLAGAGLLGAAGLLKVRQTGMEAVEALKGMGPMGEKAATGLGKVGKFAGIAAVGILAVGAAWEGVNLLWKLTGFDKQINVTKRSVEQMTSSLEKFAVEGKVSGELANTFGKDLSGIRNQTKALGELTKQLNGVKDMSKGVAGAILNAAGNGPQTAENAMQVQIANIKENYTALDKGLANLANNGNATAAKIAFEEIAKTAGITLSELRGKLPEYSKAMDAAAASTTGLAFGFGSAQANARTLAGSMQGALEAGQSMLDMFTQLNGGSISLTQAEINAEAAVRKMNAALKESNGSLDLKTEKGAAAMQSVIDLAKADGELADKTYRAKGSADEAAKSFAGIRDRFIETATKALGSAEAAHALADEFFKMPKSVNVGLTVDGLAQSIRNGESLNSILNSLDGKVSRATVTTLYQTIRQEILYPSVGAGTSQGQSRSRIPQRWGGVHEHAASGLLREASTYSPMNPGRYMIAEPQTGGEAFIPKHGNYGRSMAILDKAASWYGANISAGGQGGGAVVNNYWSVTVAAGVASTPAEQGAAVVKVIKQYEQSNGATWRK